MRMRTIHNRVERREFSFDRSDLLKLLKAEAARFSPLPVVAAAETWEMEFESDDETSAVTGVLLLQRFEYLSPVDPARPPDEALLVLARAGASRWHHWFFDAAENIDEVPPEGHVQPFETCPHPDCALVRAARPPDQER